MVGGQDVKVVFEVGIVALRLLEVMSRPRRKERIAVVPSWRMLLTCS